MTTKLPTIDIKGKEYTLVSTRILHFNEKYENGKIETELLRNDDEVVIKAKITPDTNKLDRYFTAYSQAVKGEGYINKTAALENCETSAVGRALGMMGIGIIESVASADEIYKAEQPRHAVFTPKTAQYTTPAQNGSPATHICSKCGSTPRTSKTTGKMYCPNAYQGDKKIAGHTIVERDEKVIQLDEADKKAEDDFLANMGI